MKIDSIIKIANEFYKTVTAGFEGDVCLDNINIYQENINKEISCIFNKAKDSKSILHNKLNFKSNDDKKYISNLTYSKSSSIFDNIISISDSIKAISSNFYRIFWYSGLVNNIFSPELKWKNKEYDIAIINGKIISQMTYQEFLSLLSNDNLSILLNPITHNILQITSLIDILIIDKEELAQDCYHLKELFLQTIKHIEKLADYFNFRVYYSEVINEFNQNWGALLSNVERQQEAFLDEMMEPEDRNDPERIEDFLKGKYY